MGGVITTPFRFAAQSAPEDASQWLSLARRAEDLGYSALLMPDGLHSLSPLPALAVAAGATTTLRVGTWVLAAPLRPPRLAAWDAHTLSRLTGGRFELGIGTYSLATLAPVVMSAICAVSVVRVLAGGTEFDIRVPSSIEAIDYVPILALGMLAALGGIALMRGVTLVEDLFRRSRVPAWVRPAIGGLVVGAMALVSPVVLSSGHSALRVSFDAPYSMPHIALLILLKSTASAVSIGSGFRGGLFFASLLLGALLGKLFAGLLGLMLTVQALPAVVCAMVGMSALATAVVGGPLTMAFLAL